MAELTERGKEILNSIIGEYIKSAKPISSRLIEKKYGFDVCPATIRTEMQKLTDAGFIYQPHTSAGRVPTDKGYRFYVNELLEKGFSGKKEELKMDDWIEEEIKDTVRLFQTATKNLAFFSSNLALGYLPEENILWKEGWEEMLREPEFKESDFLSDFTSLLEDFEEDIKGLKPASGIRVYIGKENPLSHAKEFSTIVSSCRLPNNEEGLLAIVGPKRMSYDKNIASLDYLIKSLNGLVNL
jgi:transcriptional regulator of heat shock response